MEEAEGKLLECRQLTKYFGGLVALDDFDLVVESGEITGLIGPNGAGKTTCFNVITGVLRPDRGEVVFRGTPITEKKTHQICHAGIARTFQTPQPLRNLTVEKNLQVAEHYGRDDEAGDPPFDIEDILGFFDLADRRNSDPMSLQLMERKYLDLARAIVTDPDLILADEIMAGLNPTEKERMNDLVRRIHDEWGIDFLVIEHDLRVIRSISHRIVVINEGQHLMSGPADEVLENEAVKEAYIGK